jgi:thiamine-monophosphate kinase
MNRVARIRQNASNASRDRVATEFTRVDNRQNGTGLRPTGGGTRQQPLEISFIDQLTRDFLRSSNQLNRRYESDAELVRIPGSQTVLALTTDGVSEEIETGLYDDPYLIGWMTVTVNASDLSAVGAVPLGLLVCETLPPGTGDDWTAALQNGIRDACEVYGLPLLGGDTNAGCRLHMGATAAGLIIGGRPLTRVGCRPGDSVYATGPLGLGTAYALVRLARGPQDRPAGEQPNRLPYRPVARLGEGQRLRSFASACMDTSDGVLCTIDELARLNDCSFRLDRPVDEMLHPAALDAARAAGVPPWLMLAGPHGEFELIFTAPADQEQQMVGAMGEQGCRPLRLGAVTPAARRERDACLTLQLDGQEHGVDTTRVRDLFAEVQGDVAAYRKGLLEVHGGLGFNPS